MCELIWKIDSSKKMYQNTYKVSFEATQNDDVNFIPQVVCSDSTEGFLTILYEFEITLKEM